MRLHDLLKQMIDENASDLYVKMDWPPRFRINGLVKEVPAAPISRQDVDEFLATLLDQSQRDLFGNNPDLDTALFLPTLGRFRVNILRQQGQPGFVIRKVHMGNLKFADLHLPDAIEKLAQEPRGLVLVTGPAGSGKSTTVAAMIEYINQTRLGHIVTVEDPIEYVFLDQKCTITQRQVGIDTLSFKEALKHVIRQSPDVIMIGEMRDLDTIMTAISAAETGHLVITTMHTSDVPQTLERIINYYPDFLRPQIRFELSLALRGIVCQRLLPCTDGMNRTPAFEIALNTPPIRKFLVEGRYYDIINEIKKNEAFGMTTLNQSLARLVKSGVVTEENAMHYAHQPDELRLLLSGMSVGIDSF